jgi:hypothetical protein
MGLFAFNRARLQQAKAVAGDLAALEASEALDGLDEKPRPKNPTPKPTQKATPKQTTTQDEGLSHEP